ncbi:DUF2085 domain-containing protein [Halosimplex rubrum]|uniref:DUF2085 domain-containing protein n=1 Tax=Halosimplex rubrum TaxID=869889 RepID=A0A7D5T0X0_9EURY|nr:DUF2085 domain-containing protein [Halosimplex rubrum]
MARELRTGLARTGRYLLSHHEPHEYDRCHRLAVGGRTVRLCARCSGVYPGILAGVALVLTDTAPAAWPWLVACGPAPALVDWAATTFTLRRGSNAIRTASGALLGLGYGVAVPWFLTARPLWLLAVAAGYGGVAAALLVRSRAESVDEETDRDGENAGENRSQGA